jgi:hypothetical protein
MPGRANGGPLSEPQQRQRRYLPVPQMPMVAPPDAAARPAEAAFEAVVDLSGTTRRNRLLVLSTALSDKDTPQWPYWKFQQLKATRAVTDMAMLAVTREDSFIAVIRDGKSTIEHLGFGRRTVEPALLKSFLDAHYRPGSYFIYGGHGVSDRIEFNSHHRMQVHELAACLGDRQFHGILFDACLMASLDTAYYLRNNTRWVGAAEGYMWEEDTWSEKHMFNPYTATLMSRDSDGGRVLRLVGEEYTRQSDMADYTLIDTAHAAALWDRVLHEHSAEMNAMIMLKPEVALEEEPVERQSPEELEDRKAEPLVVPRPPAPGVRMVNAPDFPAAVTIGGNVVPRDHLHRRNFIVPNSLFPEDIEDDHIVDLGCFIEHDEETMSLFRQVVAWRQDARMQVKVYDAPMHGLNYAFSQYALESVRRRIPHHVAEALSSVYHSVAESLSQTPSLAASPSVMLETLRNGKGRHTRTGSIDVDRLSC